MTSDEMLSRTKNLMDEVWTRMDAPLLANEVFFSFFSSAGGPGFRANVMDFSRAVRDWHRAGRAGDPVRRAKAAADISGHLRA